MVTIALDYDETYNLDPRFWDKFISGVRKNGWDVVLATYRHPVHDWHPHFEHLENNMDIMCFYTDGKAKKPYLESLGYNIDVWIDDRPKTVYEDSAWGQDSPELHAWREENKLKLGA